MQKDVESILLSEEEIREKVRELGETIRKDYEGKDLFMLAILKGSVVFMADLMRAIDHPVQIDFMSIASYGNSRKSSGIVKILKDIDQNISGKNVLIVEDIMDSGQTLSFLVDLLQARNPQSLKICTFLDKPSRRVADIQPDYYGFVVPDEFIVGYGLDFAEKYRNLPYVAALKPEAYQ